MLDGQHKKQTQMKICQDSGVWKPEQPLRHMQLSRSSAELIFVWLGGQLGM